MRSGFYGPRKGHKNRIFILLFNSLLPTPGNACSRLLTSWIKVRFLCPFLIPYKSDLISKHPYLLHFLLIEFLQLFNKEISTFQISVFEWVNFSHFFEWKIHFGSTVPDMSIKNGHTYEMGFLGVTNFYRTLFKSCLVVWIYFYDIRCHNYIVIFFSNPYKGSWLSLFIKDR